MSFPENKDVLIIGGGIIGLSLARELHKRGVIKITILERGGVGQEASAAAAGMLAPNAETDKADDFFHLCDESNRLYPQLAGELLAETGIDSELDRSGTLYLAFSDKDSIEIRRRYAWQKKAGLAVELLTAGDARRLEPFVSPDVREALFFPNDWQIENRLLLSALHKYAAINRIEIIENTAVENVSIENGGTVCAAARTRKFQARVVVLATGAWTSLIKAGGISLPEIKPLRGQIIAFKTAERLFQRVIYSPRGYIVPRRDGRILAGATVEDAGFDKKNTSAGMRFLRENALEIAPNLVNLNIAEKWAGLRPFAGDGLPILGATAESENLLIATAHYRNGILLAPKTAELLADKIVGGKESRYLKVFSPRRFQKARAI